MIKRAPRQPRHRTRLPAGYAPTVPALTWTAAIVSGKVRVTTQLPYTLQGLPTGLTVQGVAPISVTPVSATTFDLGYTATPVTTNVFLVPANEPHVRGAAGGFLNSGTTTF